LAAKLDKVKIGPVEYKIVFGQDGLVEEALAEGMKLDCFLGFCDYIDSKILITDQCSSINQKVTVIHEVLHACLFHIGCGDEEDLVTRLSPVLLAALRDNKKLVEFLTEAV